MQCMHIEHWVALVASKFFIRFVSFKINMLSFSFSGHIFRSFAKADGTYSLCLSRFLSLAYSRHDAFIPARNYILLMVNIVRAWWVFAFCFHLKSFSRLFVCESLLHASQLFCFVVFDTGMSCVMSALNSSFSLLDVSWLNDICVMCTHTQYLAILSVQTNLWANIYGDNKALYKITFKKAFQYQHFVLSAGLYLAVWLLLNVFPSTLVVKR